MKKIFLFIPLLGFFMFSCTSKEELSKKIPTSAVSITGEHADLLKVVGDSVEIKLVKQDSKGEKWTIISSVTLQNTKPWNEVDNELNKKGLNYEYLPRMGNFHVEFANENDVECQYDLTPDWETLSELLKSNEITEKNISIKNGYPSLYSKYDYNKEAFESAQSIKISRADLTTAQKAVSASDDCSSFLDEYEEFVNDYIAMVKKYKANPTDMSVLEDYQNMVEKATDMQKEAKNCKGSKYVKRVNQLNQKLARAMY